MIARPSKPSVRWTACEKPTIQTEATTTKITPSGIATFFSSGTKNVVDADTDGSAARYRNTPAATPNSDCSRYFQRDFRTLGSRRTILIQSSYQPLEPKSSNTASTSHTYQLARAPTSRTEASTVPIGRAEWRDREGTYEYISVVAVTFKN